MDISEVPMCEDHPSVPAEVICIKHKQFVCITCAVQLQKHNSKKCDSKPLKNLSSENDLKLVPLLAMQVGILQKKKQLENHRSDTDVKKMELKAKIEQFQNEVNAEIQKKVEQAMKTAEDKANALQQNNQKRLEQIEKVNDMFELEIDRLTNKKSKQATEVSLSDLRNSARNLPVTDLRVSQEFTPDKKIKDVFVQSKSLGNVLFVEDDELYDQANDDGYLEPIKVQQLVNQKTYDSLQSGDKTDSKGGPYEKLAVTEGIKGISKFTGRKSQPLPEPPSKEYENTKIISPKATEESGKFQKNQNQYVNYEELRQRSGKSSTSLEKKSATSTSIAKTPTEEKQAFFPSAAPLAKKSDGQPKHSTEPLRRGSSILEKYFGDNPEVMSANALQTTSATTNVQNKAVAISGRTDVKRRIAKLAILSSNKIVLLDELNSAVLLVRMNGSVISEQKGETFLHMVGNGKDAVAVLGRGQSLQISVYTAVGERMEKLSSTKLEPNVSDVTGFNLNRDSLEYAISGGGRVVIVSELGKTKKTLSYAKCLSGKESAGSLKTAYDFDNNSMFILNTLEKSLKRFDCGKGQLKWESKVENAQFIPREMFKGQKTVYVSYKDCIKSVAMETGATIKTVKTGTVLGEVLGVFVDESRGVGVVSSGTDTVEGSNKFGMVAL